MPRVANPEKAKLTQGTLEKVEESNEVVLVIDQKFLDDNNLTVGSKNNLVISSESEKL